MIQSLQRSAPESPLTGSKTFSPTSTLPASLSASSMEASGRCMRRRAADSAASKSIGLGSGTSHVLTSTEPVPPRNDTTLDAAPEYGESKTASKTRDDKHI